MKNLKSIIMLVGLMTLVVVAWGSDIGTLISFSSGTTISSSDMNTNFTDVKTAVNSKQNRVTGVCAAGTAVDTINSNGTVGCETIPQGDITGVTAGSGLTGGGSSGTVTVSIGTGTVTATHLASNSVYAAEIATGAVGQSEIATGGVASAEVLDNSLTANDLAPNSVGSSELASNSVYAAEIATGAVGTSEILNGTILNADISNSAAIDISKIFGEMGMESLDPSTGSYSSINSTAITTLGSITITAPKSGWIIVTMTGDAVIFGNGSVFKIGYSVNSTTAYDRYTQIGYLDGTLNYRFYDNFATTGWVGVSAGSYTIRALATESGLYNRSSANVRLNNLTGFFIPTGY